MEQSAAQNPAPGESLWEKAPAWRRLTMAASVLTLAAVATPLLLPQPQPAQPHVQVVAVAAHPEAPPPKIAASPPVQLAALPPPTHAVTPLVRPATPAPQSNVCLLVGPPAPNHFDAGKVVSFEDHATSLARIQLTQAHNGGQIDPDYVDNQRVTVELRSGQYVVFLVPKTMQVQVGDRVNVQGGYRNINLPCNYVPNLITADLGPAPAAAPPARAPP